MLLGTPQAALRSPQDDKKYKEDISELLLMYSSCEESKGDTASIGKHLQKGRRQQPTFSWDTNGTARVAANPQPFPGPKAAQQH